VALEKQGHPERLPSPSVVGVSRTGFCTSLNNEEWGKKNRDWRGETRGEEQGDETGFPWKEKANRQEQPGAKSVDTYKDGDTITFYTLRLGGAQRGSAEKRRREGGLEEIAHNFCDRRLPEEIWTSFKKEL